MLEIRLLGQFSIRLDGKLVELPSHPAQLLLAYLVLHAGAEHRRERLAGLIWPDAREKNARNNLRHALWRIHKAIGESQQTGREYLLADNSTLTFDASSDHWLDAAILGKKITGRESTEDLIRVVSAYRGEFLPGFYEDWVLLERERLQAAFEHKLQLLLNHLVDKQRWSDVLEWGEHWIAHGHAPEPAYRALMIAHARLGDMFSMAAVFQRCVESLRRELGVEPSDETRSLYEQLLNGGPAGIAPADSPKSRPGASASRSTTPHNLPYQPTPFVGREKEIAEIIGVLENPDCRLMNLIGPGGIGKTRLALQASAQVFSAFPDGVFFMPLARLRSADSLVSAIADSLRLSFYGTDSPLLQLANYLREKTMLLVVDNFEHFVEEGNVLSELLSSAPRLKMLVTSRERLHLQWEWILEVEGLEVPGDDEIESAERYSAIQMFAQTARRLNLRFSLATERSAVVRICRLAQGMPLAIELAAAWVRTLSCQEIARQIERNLDVLSTGLRDVPERHRSVRAAFEHSWQHLSPEERHVFRSLSVFQGGFSREAAEKVTGASMSLIFSLVDKSFLRRSASGRYELHELMRQYAQEKFQDEVQAAGAKADVYRRMANYYLDYAQAFRRNYLELEQEWANLMAGIHAAYLEQMWPEVVNYARVLTEAWFIRGRYAEARQAYHWACDAAQALNQDADYAECQCQWGRACIEQSDYVEAEGHLNRSLQLGQRLGARDVVGDALYLLGRIAFERAQYAEAQRLLDESRRLKEDLGDLPGIAEILQREARILLYWRKFEEAEQLGKRALDIQQRANDKRGCVRTLRLLAEIAQDQGDTDLTETYCQPALVLSEEIQDQGELAQVLYTLSEVYRRRGDLQAAHEHARRSMSLLTRMGDRKSQAQVLYQLSLIDSTLADYPAALKAGHDSLKLCRELQDAWGMVYVLRHLGDVYKQLKERDRAVAAWSEALSIAEKLDRHPLVESLRERLTAADTHA